MVRSLVPVSTRHDDGQGVPDNRVSALLYELPVHIADPVERLEVVQEQMAGLKASRIAEAGRGHGLGRQPRPPMVLGPVSRMVIRAIHRFGNGPSTRSPPTCRARNFPSTASGHEMLEYRPFVPISHGLRVGTAILSYNGGLFFGVTGDSRTCPTLDVLAGATAAGVEELRERALEAIGDHRPA